MGCYNDLESVSPEFPGKLYTDLMRLFGCHLMSGKALVSMERNNAAFLVELLFHSQEFITGISLVAVESAHEKLLLRFVLIGCVLDDIF